MEVILRLGLPTRSTKDDHHNTLFLLRYVLGLLSCIGLLLDDKTIVGMFSHNPKKKGIHYEKEKCGLYSFNI